MQTKDGGVVKLSRFFIFCLILTGVGMLISGCAEDKNYQLQRAAQKAVSSACEDLARSDNPALAGVKSITVILLQDDDEKGTVTDILQVELTRIGKYQVVLRSADEWKNILGEYSWWTERKDLMDPSTIEDISKKVPGADALLYGRVVEKKVDELEARVVVNLHLSTVPKGIHPWGIALATGKESRGMRDWLFFAGNYKKQIFYGGIAFIVFVVIVRAIRRATTPR